MSRGRFVAPENIVNSNIQKYKDRLENNQYDNMIQGTPVKVVYYNICSRASSVDDGTLDIEHYIGDESPLRFKKIIGAILYIDSKLDITLEDDIGGIKSDTGGSATIAAGTFKPNPLDFFYFEHLGSKYTFKVTSMNIDTIRSKPQYKIEYEMSKLGSVDKIESQVTETYNMIFDNIGTSDKCIISNVKWNDYQTLRSIKEAILSDYTDLFYEYRTNSFIYKNKDDLRLYSPDLTKFLIDSNLLVDDDNRDSVIIDTIIKNPDHNVTFRSSVFNSILTQTNNRLDITKTRMFYGRVGKNSHTVLGQYKQNYHCAYNEELPETDNKYIAEWFSPELMYSIKTGNIENLEDKIDIIIANFVNKKYFVESDISFINSIVVDSSLTSFVKIPLIIYIIDRNINVILADTEAF
ncbi:MAG: hypothetical protein ACRCXX_12020 [Cetobacterium sp.]|uniref:hypothetical protein n=2 Tax=Cetobacterium sp. TaxID=2071632 RepID=UPI003F38F731